jgi:hypothetical protein
MPPCLFRRFFFSDRDIPTVSPLLPANQLRLSGFLIIDTALFNAVSLGLLHLRRRSVASAQVLVPGLDAPAFPSMPPQQAQIPAIPQCGMVIQPTLAAPPPNSFSDRVTQCLQQGSAAGLTAGKGGGWSASCPLRTCMSNYSGAEIL